MGLRESQKARRRQAILDAAIQAFLDREFELVRMDEIAARADVSVVTLYNYFSDKGELFLTVAAEEGRRLLKSIDAEPNLLEGSAEDVLGRVVRNYFAPQNFLLNKALWRTCLSEAFRTPESPAAGDLTQVDSLLADQIIRIVEKLTRDGRLDPETNTIAFGTLVFNCLDAQIMHFIRSDRDDMEEDRNAAHSMIGELLRNFSIRCTCRREEAPCSLDGVA